MTTTINQRKAREERRKVAAAFSKLSRMKTNPRLDLPVWTLHLKRSLLNKFIPQMKMIRTKMDLHTRNGAKEVPTLLHFSYMKDSTRSNKGIARSKPIKRMKKKKNSKCK